MNPGAKEPEPRRGPNVRAQTFWLLLGRLPKVTRRKGGTIGSRYRSNGYTPIPIQLTQIPTHALLHNLLRVPFTG